MPERRPMVLEPLRRTELDAKHFALAVHSGQTDKAGKPYGDHLYRVADRVSNMLRSRDRGRAILIPPPQRSEVVQIAWLHDVIEDTEYTAGDLANEGFSEEVVCGVLDLTKSSTYASYAGWIDRLATSSPLSVLLVKIADVEDNSDPARLALLPAETRARLEKKYGAALPVLKAAAEQLGWKEISR